MISALWIIPAILAGALMGFFLAALMHASGGGRE